ncbi:hypothetical protein G5714_001266 [Onychostoma macrolepis]|uniref:Uncharacterized protein n=1 Tax=Onychostoma macrolepis TaxID=369639 RepID=A0A7J6DJQ1_9TELE|nr:hypothetical protein G5714_001266 [Onychostoma macrolepis]
MENRERSSSPDHSCVSLKSGRSMGPPPKFSDDPVTSDPRGNRDDQTGDLDSLQPMSPSSCGRHCKISSTVHRPVRFTYQMPQAAPFKATWTFPWGPSSQRCELLPLEAIRAPGLTAQTLCSSFYRSVGLIDLTPRAAPVKKRYESPRSSTPNHAVPCPSAGAVSCSRRSLCGPSRSKD